MYTFCVRQNGFRRHSIYYCPSLLVVLGSIPSEPVHVSRCPKHRLQAFCEQTL